MGDESRAEFVDSRRRALGIAQAPERREQAAQIERVSTRISGAIVQFMRSMDGKEFHADQLRQFVDGQVGKTAPGSADRILRDLRLRGVIAYRLVDRAKSLYLAGRAV